MNRPVPRIVRQRNRLTLIADLGIAVMVLGVALQIPQPDIAFWFWILGGLVSGVSTLGLRRSIRHQDQRPAEELDEYELQRRLDAQASALRWSTGIFMLMFFCMAVLTLVLRMTHEDDTEVYLNALLSAGFACCTALYFIQLIQLRSIAGSMNRDILISVDASTESEAVHSR